LLWAISAILNTIIAGSFAMVAIMAFSGLQRTRQLSHNSLGIATCILFIFASIGHFISVLQILSPEFFIGSSRGLALRESIDMPRNISDGFTCLAALWYWALRPKFKKLLDGGHLFSDLQQRYVDQTRELENKTHVVNAFQRALTPKDLPVASSVAFDVTYEPAENLAEVGGDWYDVFTLPDGRIGFSIGDVTGHGLEAAVLTSRAREAIAAAAFTYDSPADVLQSVNRVLVQRNSPIITAIFGVINLHTLKVSYATAGHPPPLIAFRDKPAFFCSYSGLPMGIDYDAVYETFTYVLKRGSLFVLYTDGVTEFSRDIFLGEKRLLSAVTYHAAASTASPSIPILSDVLQGQRSRDDMALLVIKFIGDPVIEDTDVSRHWYFDVKDPEAATRLRQQVMVTLRDHEDKVDLFSSELIIGELLSNVVKHTPGMITVSLSWEGEGILLSVEDAGEGFIPVPALPSDEYAVDGRGMFLVDTLSRDVRFMSLVGGLGSRVEVDLPMTLLDVVPVKIV